MKLDELIEAGLESAPVRETRDRREQIPTLKEIPPEPGEPPLIGTQSVRNGTGLFQRRILQRQHAQQRRLQFARELVSSGFNALKAFTAAGYNPNSRECETHISNLMNHPDVISEVNRLRIILEQRADVATIDLAKEWVGIASSNVFDFFDQSGDSLVLKKKGDLTERAQRTVKAVKIRRRRETRKDDTVVETEDVEVTLWDKQAALDSLAKVQGLYKGQGEEALDSLAQKIADRTEKHRRIVGKVYEGKAEPVG